MSQTRIWRAKSMNMEARLAEIESAINNRLSAIESTISNGFSALESRLSTAEAMILELTRKKSDKMKIYLKTQTIHLADLTFALDVDSTDTIGDVKAMIYQQKDIPTFMQYLIHYEDDSRTLKDYRIKDGSTIHLRIL